MLENQEVRTSCEGRKGGREGQRERKHSKFGRFTVENLK